jgi:hypothetical protein
MSTSLPCLHCTEDAAEAARAEIAAVYLNAKAGKLPARTPLPSPLPASCCRRPRGPIEVSALVA